jgi:hypothetical protein
VTLREVALVEPSEEIQDFVEYGDAGCKIPLLTFWSANEGEPGPFVEKDGQYS